MQKTPNRKTSISTPLATATTLCSLIIPGKFHPRCVLPHVGPEPGSPEGNVLRAFLYWKASFETEAWDGVDLDLSVAFYSDEKS